MLTRTSTCYKFRSDMGYKLKRVRQFGIDHLHISSLDTIVLQLVEHGSYIKSRSHISGPGHRGRKEQFGK